MKLGGIRPDDIVRCDVRGQRFYGKVSRHSDPADKAAGRARGIWLDGLDGYRHPAYPFVTARQIIEHYSKRKG